MTTSFHTHQDAFCSVPGCRKIAHRWFPYQGLPDDTFYLCEEHAEILAPDDDVVRLLTPAPQTRGARARGLCLPRGLPRLRRLKLRRHAEKIGACLPGGRLFLSAGSPPTRRAKGVLFPEAGSVRLSDRSGHLRPSRELASRGKTDRRQASGRAALLHLVSSAGSQGGPGAPRGSLSRRYSFAPSGTSSPDCRSLLPA